MKKMYIGDEILRRKTKHGIYANRNTELPDKKGSYKYPYSTQIYVRAKK